MTRAEISLYHKSHGRCQHCGKLDARTMAGGYYCWSCMEVQGRIKQEHREEYLKARAETREKRRESGLCTNCGGERDDLKMLMCSKCREKKRRKPKPKMDRWGGELCGRCLKNPKKPGYKICEECLAKNPKSKKAAADHPWRMNCILDNKGKDYG